MLKHLLGRYEGSDSGVPDKLAKGFIQVAEGREHYLESTTLCEGRHYRGDELYGRQMGLRSIRPRYGPLEKAKR